MFGLRKISDQAIDRVHHNVEHCLMKYMSKEDTIDFLAVEANISRTFTRLVWEKLEQDNPNFFEAYNKRLVLKDQIIKFNELLAQQVAMRLSESTSTTNEHDSVPCTTSSSSEQITDPNPNPNAAAESSLDSRLLNVFTNNVSLIQPCQGSLDSVVVHHGVDHTANVRAAQVLNQPIVDSEGGNDDGSSSYSRVAYDVLNPDEYVLNPDEYILDWNGAVMEQTLVPGSVSPSDSISIIHPYQQIFTSGFVDPYQQTHSHSTLSIPHANLDMQENYQGSTPPTTNQQVPTHRKTIINSASASQSSRYSF